jgi:hypothetical protein
MSSILTYRQESARGYQGASVRVQDDVPEMETFLMRLLGVASTIDLSGKYPGTYWALTNIPANHNSDNQDLPTPSSRQAVIAIEPLSVVQMEVSEDIDSVKNETAEADMRQAGYVGNKNRRAIPIIVVRYATSLPGMGTSKVLTLCDAAFLLLTV